MTELQISEWKKKYTDIYEIIIVNDEGVEFKTYFRKPDLKILSASAKFAESDPIKSGLVLFDNCWLGGDEAVKNSDELKMSCLQELGKLFKIYQATVKKL